MALLTFDFLSETSRPFTTEDMEILTRGKNHFAFRTALSLFLKTNMVLKYYSRTVDGFCATQEEAAPR